MNQSPDSGMPEGDSFPTTSEKIWKCRSCDFPLGTVASGALYLQSPTGLRVKVLVAVIECPECGHTRKWKANDYDKAGGVP